MCVTDYMPTELQALLPSVQALAKVSFLFGINTTTVLLTPPSHSKDQHTITISTFSTINKTTQ
jgi:hypothetical protein